MTFEEFLKYVREVIGNYCSDAYWQRAYTLLPDKTVEGIKKETSTLAVNVITTDYTSRHG